MEKIKMLSEIAYHTTIDFLMSQGNNETWDEIIEECEYDVHEASKVLWEVLNVKIEASEYEEEREMLEEAKSLMTLRGFLKNEDDELIESFEAGYSKVEMRLQNGMYNVYYFEKDECLSSVSVESEDEAYEEMASLIEEVKEMNDGCISNDLL